MNKGIILAIILIAAILGLGFATDYFTVTPTQYSHFAPSVRAALGPGVRPDHSSLDKNTIYPSALGVGSGPDYFTAGASTSTLSVTLPPAPRAPVAIPRINLDAALGPRPETVFTADGKRAIARYDFSIYKKPAESREEDVGIIHGGMLVEVLEKRENCLTVPMPNKPKSEKPQEESDEYEDPYAGRILDCYKVKKDDKEGWVVDRDVLNFQVPTPTRDPRDLSWFFQKYGESTWYYEQALNENSFTNEEYERLIMLALSEGGYAYDVPNIALRLTLIRALEKNPDDPRLAGFKDKVKALEQAGY